MDIKTHMNEIKNMEETPYIQIPTKIVTEVTRAMRLNNYESYSHYAFSFLVLNAFLYKYTNYININQKTYLNVSDIKKILKYNPNNQKLDAISKRDTGILEMEGFVETTTDIPIASKNIDIQEEVYKKKIILRMSDVGEEFSNYIYKEVLRTPNYFSHIPSFMTDSKKKEGTLNNYENTFKLTYTEFEYFIFNDDFTLRDFFLYCHIKSSTKKNKTAIISYDTFKRQTGISKATVIKTTKKLEELEILKIFSNKNKTYTRKSPNTYILRNITKNNENKQGTA